MAIREEKKLQTRHALMEATLGLLDSGRSFGSLSLREVTREAGIVPTAFYRHFDDMDALGLALVDDACLTLRRLIREARTQAVVGDIMIGTSVSVFLGYVSANRREFGFVIRERFGGSPVISRAISREIRYFVGELTADLSIFPHFKELPRADVEMLAGLIVNTVAYAAGDWLELVDADERTRQTFTQTLVQQLRVVILGGLAWKPGKTVPSL